MSHFSRPLRGYVATGKSSVIPAKAGSRFNLYSMILTTRMPALNHTRYRARLRGHDELGPTLLTEEGSLPY
jgi:hypothetical protein